MLLVTELHNLVDTLGSVCDDNTLHCLAAGSRCQQQFYRDLYGVTEDPQRALHVLLDKKEVFSQQICSGLMSRLLGMECSFPRSVAA